MILEEDDDESADEEPKLTVIWIELEDSITNLLVGFGHKNCIIPKKMEKKKNQVKMVFES